MDTNNFIIKEATFMSVHTYIDPDSMPNTALDTEIVSTLLAKIPETVKFISFVDENKSSYKFCSISELIHTNSDMLSKKVKHYYFAPLTVEKNGAKERKNGPMVCVQLE